MSFKSRRLVLLAGLFVLVTGIAWQSVVAEDLVHVVSGVVKSVDKPPRQSWSRPQTAQSTPSSTPTRRL